MEELLCTVNLLRNKYHFQGYIHLKAIPGAAPELIARAGYLADRMSVNLELPTAGLGNWHRIRAGKPFCAL